MAESEEIKDLNQLLVSILQNEVDPETVKYRNAILRRIATEGEIKPARIPAPQTITEVGGYFNLLMKLRETEMLKQMLASVFGLPMIQLPNGTSGDL